MLGGNPMCAGMWTPLPVWGGPQCCVGSPFWGDSTNSSLSTQSSVIQWVHGGGRLWKVPGNFEDTQTQHSRGRFESMGPTLHPQELEPLVGVPP